MEGHPPTALLIKRYPNRKLYNTRSKEYITLDEVAEIVRQGIDILVVDHTNGEDLTAAVLSQILLGKERKQSGLLPVSFLSALVNAGEDAFELARRFLVASFDSNHFIDGEIKRRIEVLTSEGSITHQEGQVWMEKLQQVGRDAPLAQFSLEQTLSRSLQAYGYDSRAEYKRLLEQVEKLSEEVDQLMQDQDS